MIYPDYVEDYGWEYSIGDWNQEGEFLASCKVIDQTVWEKMIKPACDHIVGNYPKSENDIMLSRRLLNKIGISDPEPGMKISVRILFKNWSVNGGKNLQRNSFYRDTILIIPTVLFIFQQHISLRNIWI